MGDILLRNESFIQYKLQCCAFYSMVFYLQETELRRIHHILFLDEQFCIHFVKHLGNINENKFLKSVKNVKS